MNAKTVATIVILSLVAISATSTYRAIMGEPLAVLVILVCCVVDILLLRRVIKGDLIP